MQEREAMQGTQTARAKLKKLLRLERWVKWYKDRKSRKDDAMKNTVIMAINQASKLSPNYHYLIVARRGSMPRQVLHFLQCRLRDQGIQTSIVVAAFDPKEAVAVYKLVLPEKPL